MASKKKKKSKVAAPANATPTPPVDQPEEHPMIPTAFYSSKVNKRVLEASAAAYAQFKMDPPPPTVENETWEDPLDLNTTPTIVQDATSGPNPSVFDVFDQFRELDSTSEWATCYKARENTGQRTLFNAAENITVNPFAIEPSSFETTPEANPTTTQPVAAKRSEVAATGTHDTNQTPGVTDEAFKEQQLKIQKLETELEKCKRDVKAAKLRAATARHESSKLEKLISDFSQDLRKSCTTLITDIELPPQQLNKKGEDKGYLAFKKSAANTRNKFRQIQMESADPLDSFRSGGEKIRGMAELIQTENAYLKRTRDSYKSSYADASDQLETKSQEVSKLRDEAVSCERLLHRERRTVTERQESLESVTEELDEVKKKLQDIDPLVKIGIAIRLRFLERI
ncbi:hypothetical protein DL98DRAFT_633765 [Cadophora sp. DSE1049]|nr:hypothetical protein DL98DRAFT_633765 [Cadophora sp. DSE1049]